MRGEVGRKLHAAVRGGAGSGWDASCHRRRTHQAGFVAYYKSPDFKNLQDSTQAHRQRIIEKFRAGQIFAYSAFSGAK
jgi:hypothetical protein